MAIKPLNSVAGFSVGENPANIILANGDITTNNITTTGVANLNSIGNVKISGGSSGQVIQTDGSGVLSFVTIDTWRIQNGTSNVAAGTLNGNITVSVAGNANIATFTSTGANISGYLTVDGNITANGNLSANNYLVTPTSKDLIIAPATSLIRSYANINPYTDGAYDLGNGLARWSNVFANVGNFAGNVSVTGTANVGNLRTDNLLHANGTAWDFATAAGSNTWVQYSNGTDLAASANLTYDDATQKLTLTGNANITNTLKVNQEQLTSVLTQQVIYANGGSYLVGSANYTFNDATNVLTVNGNIVASNASATNGIKTDNLYYSNGSPWDIGGQPAGSNTQIQYNNGANDFAASANLTYDDATQQFYLNGSANITGNIANANNIKIGRAHV